MQRAKRIPTRSKPFSATTPLCTLYTNQNQQQLHCGDWKWYRNLVKNIVVAAAISTTIRAGSQNNLSISSAIIPLTNIEGMVELVMNVLNVISFLTKQYKNIQILLPSFWCWQYNNTTSTYSNAILYAVAGYARLMSTFKRQLMQTY